MFSEPVGRPTTRIVARLAVVAACLAGGCAGDAASWGERDHFRIYEAALEAIRREVRVDTLVVEPRPRFLVEDAGAFRMGDFSEFGDPTFSRVIDGTSWVAACHADSAAGCGRAANEKLATVSEVLRLGPREAGVLASFIDMRQVPIVTRAYQIQLRYSDGGWRVVRIAEGDVVRRRGGGR
jgi:hypothetical protein